MKQQNRYARQLAEYIMETEGEDLIENLEDQDISPYQQRLIFDWYYDHIGTTQEVKSAFKDMARNGNGHIYASAFCFSYDIEEN